MPPPAAQLLNNVLIIFFVDSMIALGWLQSTAFPNVFIGGDIWERAMADRRTDATRGKIKQAFTELVAERGFDRLSVSDVARRAGINRGTVYLHFVDKFDLMRQLEDEALSALSAILFTPGAGEGTRAVADIVPDERVLAALRYVQSDAAFFTALIGPGGDPLFADRFKRGIGDHLVAELIRAEGDCVDVGDVPPEYVREIALGGIMAVIELWLKRGCNEPAELIASIIDRAKRRATLGAPVR